MKYIYDPAFDLKGWFDQRSTLEGWFDQETTTTAGGGSTLALTPETGRLSIRGKTASLTLAISPTTGHLSLRGKTASLTRAMAPTAGHLALRGYAPSIELILGEQPDEEQQQQYHGGGRRRREDEEADQVRKQWELLELRKRNQAQQQIPPAPEVVVPAAETPRPAAPASEVAVAREALQRVLLEAERGAAEQRAEDELELLQIAMLAVIAVDDD